MKLKLIAVGLLLTFSATAHAMSMANPCKDFGMFCEGGGGGYQAENDGRDHYGHKDWEAARKAREKRAEREDKKLEKEIEKIEDCMKSKGKKYHPDC